MKGISGQSGEIIAAQYFSNHPRYKVGTKTAYFDIAVITLVKMIEFSKTILPICLPTDAVTDPDSHANEFVTLTGWGLEARNQDPRNIGPLRSRNLGIFSHEYF